MTNLYVLIQTRPGTIRLRRGAAIGEFPSGHANAGQRKENAAADNNTITFKALADKTYSNCKISVENNSNMSDNLSVSPFTIDTTPPTLLDNLTIASNNTLNTTLAKIDDNITLSITSVGTIQAPTVSIAGQAATVTGDNMTWSATYKMEDNYSQGSVSLNIGFFDLAGNPGDNVTSTSNGSAVRFDSNAPTLDNVTIASSNSVPTLAKTGDNITLSITFEEAIQTPTVKIAGQTATSMTSVDNITWSAVYTMADNNSEGSVSLEIGFFDLAGNPGIVVTSTSNDNESAVLFDKTAPRLDNVTAFTTPSLTIGQATPSVQTKQEQSTS